MVDKMIYRSINYSRFEKLSLIIRKRNQWSQQEEAQNSLELQNIRTRFEAARCPQCRSQNSKTKNCQCETFYPNGIISNPNETKNSQGEQESRESVNMDVGISMNSAQDSKTLESRKKRTKKIERSKEEERRIQYENDQEFYELGLWLKYFWILCFILTVAMLIWYIVDIIYWLVSINPVDGEGITMNPLH